MRSVEANVRATNVAQPEEGAASEPDEDEASPADDEAVAAKATRARHSRTRRSAFADGAPCAVRNAARVSMSAREM
jgi:hypothetical protein